MFFLNFLIFLSQNHEFLIFQSFQTTRGLQQVDFKPHKEVTQCILISSITTESKQKFIKTTTKKFERKSLRKKNRFFVVEFGLKLSMNHSPSIEHLPTLSLSTPRKQLVV